MLPGIPTGTSPDPAELSAALGSATWGELTLPGRCGRELGADDRAALAHVARALPGGARPDFFDPPGSAEIALERDGERLGALIVHPDLAVRWSAWRAAALVESPAALGEWLSARGAPGPLAAFHRRSSPAEAQRQSAFLQAAPPALRPFLARLSADPWARDHALYNAAWGALVSGSGSAKQSVFLTCAWLGERRGPWSEGPDVEAVADGLLRTFGVHEVIAVLATAAGARSPDAAAPAGGHSPDAAAASWRAGAARFLVENVRSRGWDLRARLPEGLRSELVEAAHQTAGPDDGLRARCLLLDAGPLAPEGTQLIAAAQAGRLRRVTPVLDASIAGVAAIDGGALVHITRAKGRVELLRLMRPDTPLASRGDDLFFLHTSGPRSVSLTTGKVRDRGAPWFGLPARRMSRDSPAHHRSRDAALAPLSLSPSTMRVLRVDRSEREAYEAFGGDLPSALRQPLFWACDVPGRRLISVSSRGVTREFPLDGEPRLLGAQGDRVFALVAHNEHSVSVTTVGPGEARRSTKRCSARPDAVCSVHLVGDDVWLRLCAPLGDVIVSLGF